MYTLQLHFWLEKTAYFKMPKGQEQERAGAKRTSLEEVCADAFQAYSGCIHVVIQCQAIPPLNASQNGLLSANQLLDTERVLCSWLPRLCLMWRALPAWAATTELSRPLRSLPLRRQLPTWRRSAPHPNPRGATLPDIHRFPNSEGWLCCEEGGGKLHDPRACCVLGQLRRFGCAQLPTKAVGVTQMFLVMG